MSRAEIKALSTQIQSLREQVAVLVNQLPPETVRDYDFVGAEGHVSLRELFGDHRDLIIIHNMGGSCPYCALWADGFNGFTEHIGQRAAFVVVSPDTPAQQAAIASQRGWRFRMVQDASRDFTSAMGYWTDKEGWYPGFSAFHLDDDGTILRTGTEEFGPMDDWCMIWPLFARLRGGANGWEPK